MAKRLSYIEEARCLKVKVVTCAVVDWINLAQNRLQWRGLVNTTMSFLSPKEEERFSKKCAAIRISRRVLPHGRCYSVSAFRLLFN